MVLLHALTQRADGSPAPFSVSCKAALYRLPSWFPLAFVLYALPMVSRSFAGNRPFSMFQLQFFGLLFPGPRGSYIDSMTAFLGTAFVLFIIVVPLLTRMLLLMPAFTVLDHFRFGAAQRLSARISSWRNVYEIVPFLLLLFLALHLDYWEFVRVFVAGSAAHTPDPTHFSIALSLSAVLRILVLQAAVALLLVATIPVWMQVRERTAAEVEALEGGHGRTSATTLHLLLRYTGVTAVIVCVHFFVMYHLMIFHALAIAGTGGSSISFDSPEAVMAGAGPIFLVLNLPLVPWFLMTGQFEPFLGGLPWAVTVVVILESWRRLRRRRMTAAAQNAEE